MCYLEAVGDLGGDFSHKNTPEGLTGTHKSSFSPYKQANGNQGWRKITNVFILYDLFWKVQKSHAANSEGSFKDEAVIQLKSDHEIR